MEIIKDLDMFWFWLGYTCGANSRKRIVQSPNKIVNLGKQGITTTPTDKQKVSFFIGLKLGRGKIVQNFNIVKVIQHQDKNAHKSKGDYLTLQLGTVETTRGSTVGVPLFICNNSVDNRGFSGYQAKIKYNPNHLTLTNCHASSLWTSSFKEQHDSSTGIVLLQGLSDEIRYEDLTVAWLEFKVSADAPSSNILYVQGPSGTGAGSDIITRINGENYFIQPITLENGEITLTDEEPTPTPSISIPSDAINLPINSSPSDRFGDSTDFTYEFDLDLRYVEGSGSGSGANFIVNIQFGDGTSERVSIPVQEGDHHYSSKLPLNLPSIKPGPIIIDYWVEPIDPEDFFYWFIKAGALWGFETIIPRDEVGTLPIELPKVSVFEGFRVRDGFRISYEGSEPTPEAKTHQIVGEILQVFDGYSVLTSDDVEDIAGRENVVISDGFRISYE